VILLLAQALQGLTGALVAVDAFLDAPVGLLAIESQVEPEGHGDCRDGEQ
jgi:hypothetical protein